MCYIKHRYEIPGYNKPLFIRVLNPVISLSIFGEDEIGICRVKILFLEGFPEKLLQNLLIKKLYFDTIYRVSFRSFFQTKTQKKSTKNVFFKNKIYL